MVNKGTSSPFITVIQLSEILYFIQIKIHGYTYNCYIYIYICPSVIKHGWLENTQTEWRFLARKITDQWSIFHCHVWLPEGNRGMNDYTCIYVIATLSYCILNRSSFFNGCPVDYYIPHGVDMSSYLGTGNLTGVYCVNNWEHDVCCDITSQWIDVAWWLASEESQALWQFLGGFPFPLVDGQAEGGEESWFGCGLL